MITVNILSPWQYCSPFLYRYLESEYVENFFLDGSMRLSSFKRFRKHKDEERLDLKEGKSMYSARTSANGGQTIEALAEHGMNAYVLCTTMRLVSSVQESFKTDSFFRIDNSTEFGIEISRQIPGFVTGFEGPCIYQEKRIVTTDSGYVDTNSLRGPSAMPTPSGTRLEEHILSSMGHRPLFLKEASFSHQMEYRFVWIVDHEPEDFWDIKVPRGRSHCQHSNDLMY